MKRGLLFYQSPAGVQLQHQETQVNTWLPKNSRHDFTLRQSPVTSLLEVKGGVNEWLLGDQENSAAKDHDIYAPISTEAES